MKALAQALRRQATDAERMLWQRLRSRNMAGFKFRRQVVIEPYVVDFVCFEAKLIIEADGGQHGLVADKDARRTRELERMGYRVKRFWNHEILNEIEVVLGQIYCCLNTPHPNPLPEGEGVV
ncbi:MAG: endonuclease domain-containing protein [Gammaproteobacteria bacterium]|nr:endonuclease domain-containing protein [Gammaproteobacteria bacterium]